MTRAGKGALVGAALLAAIGLVSKWEGREYEPYQDIVGVWTVCDGITRGVDRTRRYTDAECDARLAEELQIANGYIDRCITVPISPMERAAYVSAGYNLGPSVMCGSTLQRKLNAGDHEGACRELPRWNRAGGQVVRGLTNRRAEEMRVCLSGLE